jgi:hypothetical protein
MSPRLALFVVCAFGLFTAPVLERAADAQSAQKRAPKKKRKKNRKAPKAPPPAAQAPAAPAGPTMEDLQTELQAIRQELRDLKESQPVTAATDEPSPLPSGPAPTAISGADAAGTAATVAVAPAGPPPGPPSRTGNLTVGLSLAEGYSHVVHPAVDDIVGAGVSDIQHDVDQMYMEARMRVGVFVTERIGLEASVPFRYFKSSRRYLDAAAENEIVLTYPDNHHRNETLTGIADSSVMASYVVLGAPTYELRVGVGVSVPLGKVEDQNPNVAGEMNLPHQHYQFGTGTFDPMVQVGGRATLASWKLRSWASTTQVLYDNKHGFRGSDLYGAGLEIGPPLGLDPFALTAALDLRIMQPLYWDGVATNEGGLSKKQEVFGVVGATWKRSPDLGAGFSIRYPVYRNVVGGADITDVIGIGLNVDGTFDVW